MAADLLPTSNLRPDPDTSNTALIYFNTTTSSPRPAAGVYRRNWPFQTEVSNQTRPLACLILTVWKLKLFKTPHLSVWSHATEFSRFFLCFFHIYSFKFVLLCFFFLWRATVDWERRFKTNLTVKWSLSWTKISKTAHFTSKMHALVFQPSSHV